MPLDAADHVCATSHGGQGVGSGGSGWSRNHPAGTRSVRFPGSVQEGALALEPRMVTEQDNPGGQQCANHRVDTQGQRGRVVPGPVPSDGGSDASASGAASDAVPLQLETVHSGMALGHRLPQIQNQVAGRLPSDMITQMT